jgi:hypothetical protein
MKKVFVLCVSLWLIAVEGKADFKMPKQVYRMDRLEEAKADAETQGKPVTIIWTHEKTSCGLCAAASLNAADKLSKKTVAVYADCDTEWQKLPTAVQQALRAPELGRFVPKTVIMDAALTNVLGVVPYARGPEQDRLLKNVTKKLPKATPKSRLARTPTPQPTMPTFSIPPAEDREFRTWKALSGATVEAILVHERSRRIALRKKDGTMAEILVTNLTKDDQDYLQKIRNESSNQPNAGDGK